MDKDGLSSTDSILGLAVRIKREWVKKANSKIYSGKASGRSRNVEGFC